MIKVGDRAKGFEFAEGEERMTESMYRYIGLEGTIVEISNDVFRIEFDNVVRSPKYLKSNSKCFPKISWWYPISKYLEIQREERLNELGILCDAEIPQKSGI